MPREFVVGIPGELVGQDDAELGHGFRIRIAVGGDFQRGGCQEADSVVQFMPVGAPGCFEMADVKVFLPGGTAGIDRFGQGLQQLVALAAEVRRVGAFEVGQHLQQRGDLRRRGETARRIQQPGRKSRRPLTELFAQERRRLFDVERFVPIAADRPPERVVPAQRRDVDGRAAALRLRGVTGEVAPGDFDAVVGVQMVQVVPVAFRDRERRQPAVAGDFGGDALGYLAGRLRRGQDRQIGVPVRIDEPGGERQPAAVDGPVRAQGGEHGSGVGDPVAVGQDVA